MVEVQREVIESNKMFWKKRPLAVIRDMDIYLDKIDKLANDALKNPCHDTVWELEKHSRATGSIGYEHKGFMTEDDYQFDFDKFKKFNEENGIIVIYNSPNTQNYLFLNISESMFHEIYKS